MWFAFFWLGVSRAGLAPPLPPPPPEPEPDPPPLLLLDRELAARGRLVVVGLFGAGPSAERFSVDVEAEEGGIVRGEADDVGDTSPNKLCEEVLCARG